MERAGTQGAGEHSCFAFPWGAGEVCRTPSDASRLRHPFHPAQSQGEGCRRRVAACRGDVRVCVCGLSSHSCPRGWHGCAVGFRQLSVLSLILFKVTVKNPHKTLLMKWKSVQIYPPAYRCLCFLSPNNCSLRFSFMILKGLFLSNNESEQSTSCAFWSLDCGGRWAGIGGLGVRALPFFFLSLLTLFIFTLRGGLNAGEMRCS